MTIKTRLKKLEGVSRYYGPAIVAIVNAGESKEEEIERQRISKGIPKESLDKCPIITITLATKS